MSSRLLWMPRKPELLKPQAHLVEEPTRVGLALETGETGNELIVQVKGNQPG